MTYTQIGFTIDGINELDKRLGDFEEAIQHEILRDATLAGALILVNAVKTKALELHILETGTMIRSYHIGGHPQLTPDFNPGEGYADIGGEINGGTFYELAVGTNVPYAARQEFGFADTDSLGRTYNYPARPHMRPAFDTMRDEVQEEIADTVREKMRKFTGG